MLEVNYSVLTPLSNCKPTNKIWNYQCAFLYLIAFVFSVTLVKWNLRKKCFPKSCLVFMIWQVRHYIIVVLLFAFKSLLRHLKKAVKVSTCVNFSFVDEALIRHENSIYTDNVYWDWLDYTVRSHFIFFKHSPHWQNTGNWRNNFQ